MTKNAAAAESCILSLSGVTEIMFFLVMLRSVVASCHYKGRAITFRYITSS